MKLNAKNVTYLPEKKSLKGKWWLIDADGQVVGKLATRIASLLRGKGYPRYTPFFDCGDFVVVINARKVYLSGRKEEQKIYYRHSGYPGGLRETSFQQMMATHPERIIMHAVKNMLPKNRLSRKMMTKLRVFPDAEHRHQSQKPEPLIMKGGSA